MTLESKTPKARREARNYCRRCLAVMLCCVLAFGLTVRVTPRAEATSAAVADIISGFAGSSATDALESSLGLSGLNAAAGISFLVDFGNKLPEQVEKQYQAMGYSLGKELSDYLLARNDAVSEWWSQTLLMLESQGGFSPGMHISIPAYVAEALRLWAVENIDFTDGVATYTQSGIYTDSGFLTFSQFPPGAVYREMYYYANYGTVISCPPAGQILSYRFEDRNGTIFRYDFYLNSKDQFQIDYYRDDALVKQGKWSNTSSFTFVFAPESAISPRYLAIRPSGRVLSTGAYYEVQYLTGFSSSRDFLMAEEAMPLDNAFDITTTVQAPAGLSEPVTKDVEITIPQDVPVVDIDGVSIPAYGDLGADTLTGTGEETDNPAVPGATPWDKVLAGLDGIGAKVGALPQSIADAIAGAWPITGSIAGDQTVEQVMTEPDSLGALVITKFPFCIPWDIVQAIKLLAAPPTPPRFEFDMYSAMDGYGGFHSSTPVVIDFEPLEPAAAIVRWASMVGFIYCLAMGTKRLIWTA